MSSHPSIQAFSSLDKNLIYQENELPVACLETQNVVSIINEPTRTMECRLLTSWHSIKLTLHAQFVRHGCKIILKIKTICMSSWMQFSIFIWTNKWFTTIISVQISSNVSSEIKLKLNEAADRPKVLNPQNSPELSLKYVQGIFFVNFCKNTNPLLHVF